MTIPLSDETYGLCHHHDQQNGLLIVLYWRPNQLGAVRLTTWTGQGKWYVIVGQQDTSGTWTWSAEREAFAGTIPRPELDHRADGVLELYLGTTSFLRCKKLLADGTSTWA